MTYPVNSVKQDPDSGMIAQRTNNNGDRAWMVFSLGTGNGHFVSETDVASWSDLSAG